LKETIKAYIEAAGRHGTSMDVSAISGKGKGGKNGKDGKGKQQQVVCHKCGKPGHKSPECWSKGKRKAKAKTAREAKTARAKARTKAAMLAKAKVTEHQQILLFKANVILVAVGDISLMSAGRDMFELLMEIRELRQRDGRRRIQVRVLHRPSKIRQILREVRQQVKVNNHSKYGRIRLVHYTSTSATTTT
jgi:hypothetical protein